MQKIDHTGCPASVVGSVTTWEDWESLASVLRPEGCDWLELRLDMIPESRSFEELCAIRPSIPLLVTMRRQEEGGCRASSDIERIALLERWLPYVDAIDIEIDTLPSAESLVSSAKERGVRIIASAHDFVKTPELDEMRALELQARNYGADIAKFAFMLNAASDIQVGCDLFAARSGEMAVMGMGAFGPCSRLLYAQLGSSLVYGSYGETPSAPGQWRASDFKRALSLLTRPGF